MLQPWHMEDVVLFLSDDGDSEPIYLWRKRPESADAALKQVFEQHGLGALCIDVCRELGVTGLYDLE